MGHYVWSSSPDKSNSKREYWAQFNPKSSLSDVTFTGVFDHQTSYPMRHQGLDIAFISGRYLITCIKELSSVKSKFDKMGDIKTGQQALDSTDNFGMIYLSSPGLDSIGGRRGCAVFANIVLSI